MYKDFVKRPDVASTYDAGGVVDGYLLALFCEGLPHRHNGAVFLSGDIHTNSSFHLDPQHRWNFTTPNFHDHDDTHLIWEGDQWLDYQISFQQWTTRGLTPRPSKCNGYVVDRYTCKNLMMTTERDVMVLICTCTLGGGSVSQ